MDYRIEKRIVIRAGAGTVYRALTESEALARWFADRAESRPIEGGSVVLMWGTGEQTRGARAVFTRLIPGSEASLRWVMKIQPGQSTPVAGSHESVFSIVANPEGVVVTMRDDMSPAPSDTDRAKMDQEWDQTLVALKTLCEGPDAPAADMPDLPAAKSVSREVAQLSRMDRPKPKAPAKRTAKKTPPKKKPAGKKATKKKKNAKKKATPKKAPKKRATKKKATRRTTIRKAAPRKARATGKKTKKATKRAKTKAGRKKASRKR